jgi:2-polyprenyl-3-methyl-5-hydroxy-6-metoxy-1,4-benzoquinol methylase
MFLLAGEKPVSTNEMVSTVAETIGAKGARFRVPFGPLYLMAATMEFSLRPIGIQPPLHRRRMDFFKKSFQLSWQRASEILGYHPKVSFKEGALQTAGWYKSMGMLQNDHPAPASAGVDKVEELTSLESKFNLAARIEPFDSFWEAPDDIEKGYSKFGAFYNHNYLKYFPENKQVKILVISCGPGYMVNLLKQEGYFDVLGIDSMPEKIAYAVARNLNCKAARAFDFLDENEEPYDVIFCEQEINHLTKEEIFHLLELCKKNLKKDGILIIHSLNGANPVVGSENLALNFDHFNLLTEKSLIQLLDHCKFRDIKPIPLRLYVFYKNPANYIGLLLDAVMTKVLQYTFKFYGKDAKIFTKKIAAICKK